MPNVRVSYEQARGCGYRKPGGLYMVSGALTRPCGKLPIPLHVCPTCGGGVKATRSYQWIMPRLLFSGVECRDKDHVVAAPLPLAGLSPCRDCLCGMAMPERGGLLWVGGAYYKTPEDFMREARVQGVSRRISALPKGFAVGETVVYLAHRQVPTGRLEKFGQEVEKGPAVFSAFVPRAVEYVVKGTETVEELERFEKRGIELVDVKHPQGELPLDGVEDDDDG